MSGDPVYQFAKGSQTRWFTAENPTGDKGGGCLGNDGRKRNACICPLKAGETAVLAEVKGMPGMVRRIWMTPRERTGAMLRGLRLRFFWDGSEKPAVDVPLGDFFCQAMGKMVPFENYYFSSPEGRSIICCLPMPFRSGARITITNEMDQDLTMLFYEVDITIGDQHPPETLYFHAHWRRENSTTLGRDYCILPAVEGHGRFLGCFAGVAANTEVYFGSWWGEGEVKVFVDGDRENPTLCGTGTEDYIGTGWGQGTYDHAFHGCLIADTEAMRYSFYRLHVPDPVWFSRDIRVVVQQIGCWNPDNFPPMHESGIKLRYGQHEYDMDEARRTKPYGFFEREDDWSSCAWFYLNKPESALPELQCLEERLAGLDSHQAVKQALA